MIGHVVKLVYFGGIAAAESDLPPIWLFVLAAALAIAGTSLARQVLERLTDAQFRRWTKLLVMASSIWRAAQIEEQKLTDPVAGHSGRIVVRQRVQ